MIKKSLLVASVCSLGCLFNAYSSDFPADVSFNDGKGEPNISIVHVERSEDVDEDRDFGRQMPFHLVPQEFPEHHIADNLVDPFVQRTTLLPQLLQTGTINMDHIMLSTFRDPNLLNFSIMTIIGNYGFGLRYDAIMKRSADGFNFLLPFFKHAIEKLQQSDIRWPEKISFYTGLKRYLSIVSPEEQDLPPEARELRMKERKQRLKEERLQTNSAFIRTWVDQAEEEDMSSVALMFSYFPDGPNKSRDPRLFVFNIWSSVLGFLYIPVDSNGFSMIGRSLLRTPNVRDTYVSDAEIAEAEKHRHFSVPARIDALDSIKRDMMEYLSCGNERQFYATIDHFMEIEKLREKWRHLQKQQTEVFAAELAKVLARIRYVKEQEAFDSTKKWSILDIILNLHMH